MPAVFSLGELHLISLVNPLVTTKADAKRQKTEEGFVARPAQEPLGPFWSQGGHWGQSEYSIGILLGS